MSQVHPVAADAPLHVGTVSLVVRDLERVADFYRQVVGLQDVSRDGRTLRLGAGGKAFLDLVHEPAAALASPKGTGLFHTAFLLPTRGDLGRWLVRAAADRTPIQGASDHAVSEAIYLADPEGNGIEIYADRPAPDWPRRGDEILMTTERLDVEALMASAGSEPFDDAPAGTYIGHIHLQVGSIEEAEGFYSGVLGLDPVARMPSASFLSSGGYHHHVGANIWNSRGAPPRGTGTTGLQSFELIARDEAAFEAAESGVLRSGRTAARQHGSLRLTDPFNIGVHVTRA